MDDRQTCLCPNCQMAIESRPLGYGLIYCCDNCGGTAVGVNALKRRNADISFVNQIWRQTREDPMVGDKACPFCSQLMNRVRKEVRGNELELDVCCRCMIVWLDGGEEDVFPKTVEGEDLSYVKGESVSDKVKEAFAIFEIGERKRQDNEMDLLLRPPDTFTKIILTVLGFPVRSSGSTLNIFPVAVWSISAIMIITYAFTAPTIDEIALRWGMLSSEWYRNFGLTFVTSLFLHADIAHLIYNLYFFMLFGSHAEESLGRLRFILLVLLSHLVGVFFHFLLSPESGVPVIGASAGVSGILAYYAVAFPKDKITIFWFFRWWRIWAIYALVVHIIFQLFGLISQIYGFSSVSYIAHLGGIGVGIWIALWSKSEAGKDEYPEAGNIVR